MRFFTLLLLCSCRHETLPSSPTEAGPPLPLEDISTPARTESVMDAATLKSGDPDDSGHPHYPLHINTTWAFSCEIPPSFLPLPKDADGRGQTFEWKERRAKLRAWAMASKQPARELFGDWTRRDGLKHKRLEGNEWWVGGSDRGIRFESRSVLKDGIISTVEVHFEPKDERELAPLAEYILSTLALTQGGLRTKMR